MNKASQVNGDRSTIQKTETNDAKGSIASSGSLLLAEQRDPVEWQGPCPRGKRWTCCQAVKRFHGYNFCEWLTSPNQKCLRILCCSPDLENDAVPNSDCGNSLRVPKTIPANPAMCKTGVKRSCLPTE